MIYNKRVFSFREFLPVLDLAMYSVMKRRKELRQISKEFQNHIMLAVTEVNGCRVCSYYHASNALKWGYTEAEIAYLLEGDLEKADAKEAKALLFAQHYAEVRGSFDPEAFDAIVKEYGADIALGVLANIRMIMMGNAFGIAWSAFWGRFRRRKVEGSRLGSEILILFGSVLWIPFFMLKNIICKKRAD